MPLECIRTCALSCPHVMLSLGVPDVRTSVWVTLAVLAVPEMALGTRRAQHADQIADRGQWRGPITKPFGINESLRSSRIWIFGSCSKIRLQWAYWRVWQSVALMKEKIIQISPAPVCMPLSLSLAVSAVNWQFSVIDICEIKGGLVRKPLFHVGKSGWFTGW